jgi:hypothetical protein
VIGSSFISMELVVAVSKRKLASIDVIGMEEYPFEAKPSAPSSAICAERGYSSYSVKKLAKA